MALVITIVILFILAVISIQAITNTGLFTNEKRAAEESKYANAEEKVKMAVMASYDENASLNKDLLKDSLNKIDRVNDFKDTSSLTTNYRTGSYGLLTTGSTEQVLKKGLYDVAGNLW